ncbi:hypothetical protein RHSIM_Rhsim10G0142300 [Rhododendron simsii]|uniref:Xylanase inhibitor C-terminal domain-containing protein n=1 Tax=Rhododendron simsii TaxID=118357 RepID=A0A834GDM9_RHOSS|nr:hypothetical protein RHSIM_Rhsim10G0142300 [Rhododendron simsii]
MNRGSSRLQKFSEMVTSKNPNITSMCFPPQPTLPYNPQNSSSFSTLSCTSTLCKALEGSCENGCLIFYYYFGSGSLNEGSLDAETFTFDKPVGVVGLGRGPLSLVSQLDEPKFSYSLNSINGTKPSALLMGSQARVNFSSGAVKTTPLIQNPVIPTFYYISLQGITVGSVKLAINETTFALNANGTGGIIIDSGTSMTYLVESAFTLVKNEFISTKASGTAKFQFHQARSVLQNAIRRLKCAGALIDIPFQRCRFRFAEGKLHGCGFENGGDMSGHGN